MLVVWKKALAASTIGLFTLSSVGFYADAAPPEPEPEQEAALMDQEEVVLADQEAAIVQRKIADFSGSTASGSTGGSATSAAGAVVSAAAGDAAASPAADGIAGLSANAPTALGLVGLLAARLVIANDGDKSRQRSVPSAPDTNSMPPVAARTTSTSGR